MKKDLIPICPKQYRKAVDSCIDINSVQYNEKIKEYPQDSSNDDDLHRSDTKNMMRNG